MILCTIEKWCKIMECKKCQNDIKTGTYCMRCGTDNSGGAIITPTQERPVMSTPSVEGQLTSAQAAEKLSSMDIKEYNSILQMRDTEPVETGALTAIVSVIIVFAFLTTLELVSTILLYGVFTGSISSYDELWWKIMIVLIPVAGLIATGTKNYIDKTYLSSGEEAVGSILRSLLQTSIKVWGILFLVKIVLPYIILLLKAGEFSFEILKITFDILWIYIKEIFKYIIIYFGFLGTVAVLLNATKQRYDIIKNISVVASIVIVVWLLI
jgi:hypothetical protein